MKPKHLFIAAVVVLFFAFSAIAGSSYVASELGKAFHYPNCRYVARIRRGNIVYFDNREDAMRAGYTPCHACKP